MAMKTSKILLIILVTTALLYSPRPLSGHVYFKEAIFTYSQHPDFPLEKFAQGELGVLQPTYARSYLYVAYRYLIGTGFDQQEQQAILALWDERLTRRWNSGKAWIVDWHQARNRVPGVGSPPSISAYRRQGYSYYLNYPEDAFRTAVRTLNERIEKFGVNSPEVRDWVQAQDGVFANCSGDETIPAPAKPGMHPLIQADRAYQIAAANFYAGNFDMAGKMFRDIAKDASSSWRQIAPYLVARTLVRKATLGAGPTDMDLLAQAETQLKKVLSDSSLSTMHPAAQRLLNLIRFRLYPNERLHELAQAVLKKNSGKTLKQDLWNYTLLLDKFVGNEEEYEQEIKFEELSGVKRKDDVTNWIFTFQADGKAALEHSLQKWGETSSLPWLVASLSKIDAGHPKLLELLEAAGKVEQDSPAFLSVVFHSIRLMRASERKAEARERLDSLLSKGGLAFPPSSLNLFLAQRLKVARNLDEFLKYAQRVPVGIIYGPDDFGEEIDTDRRVYLDADSTKVLNRNMPLSLLKEAATSKILPDYLRRELALATWVRSVLLDNEVISRELVPILEDLVPELKEFLNAYLVAETTEARKFAAVFLMLKFPGTQPYIDTGLGRQTPLNQIDNYRDNWWCAFDTPAPRRLNPWRSAPIDFLDFLDEGQKAAAKEKWEKLSAIDTAPNYLCLQVIEWAKRKPDDPCVPEALHLAVKSTHFGCTDKETFKFSKQAFQLLHKRYPKSSWARKTKYWY